MTGATDIVKDIKSKMYNVQYACDKLHEIDANIRRTINQKQAYKELLQKELEDAAYGNAMAIGAIGAVLQYLDINMEELRKISADLSDALEKL